MYSGRYGRDTSAYGSVIPVAFCFRRCRVWPVPSRDCMDALHPPLHGGLYKIRTFTLCFIGFMLLEFHNNSVFVHHCRKPSGFLTHYCKPYKRNPGVHASGGKVNPCKCGFKMADIMNPFAGSLAPVSGMRCRQTAGSASAPVSNSTGPCSFVSLKVLSIIILSSAGCARRTIHPRPSVPARACYPPQDQPAWSACILLVSNCLNPS